MYIIANANESTSLGSGDTKDDALKNALCNLRDSSYDDDEYKEKEAALLNDLKNSEQFQDAYGNWCHYIKAE